MACKTNEAEYLYVGGFLRDDLVNEIDALGWEGDDATRAAKVRLALSTALPRREGFMVNVSDWDWEDYGFVRDILVDGVEESHGHTALSRGIALGGTPIGRQIRALKQKL